MEIILYKGGHKMISNEVDIVFELQQENKFKIKQTTAKERISKLKKLNNVIIENKEEILKAIYNDFKKPEEEVILTEIYPVTTEIKHTIRNLHKWMRDEKVRTPITYFGAKCKIRKESRGVSLIISPWNYPFQLTMDPLVSAISAGNCVIIKPSEYSPATTACIKNIIEKVFDKSEVAVFEGDHNVSKMLLNRPFDNIFFTGSPTVGKIVMEAAAKNLSMITLELGGKSPVIIEESGNLEDAAKKIAWGKTLNAGQTCVAPDYLFVPEDKKDKFIELYIKYINIFFGPMDICEDLKYCRIITKKHYNRIADLIEDAVSKGAKLRFGGIFNEEDNYISPAILTDVSSDSKILEEEIFGPVLPIITYKNINEVITYINSKPKPLALYIFSKDNAAIQKILMNTESGDVLINDVIVHVGNTNLPFGGCNNSGIGKSHGYHGFMAFTHERSIMKQANISTISMFYPPYKNNVKCLIEKFVKYF